MSDLTATNCGCANSRNNNCFMGGSCIWIILLLIFCGGCGNGCGNGIFSGSDCNDNNCCEWIIWILLLSCFCGNGCGCNSCN